MKITLSDLRRHALACSLAPQTTLGRAISRLGFVQADPIRSPARVQDLILRHRVTQYRVGDLDRNYRAPCQSKPGNCCTLADYLGLLRIAGSAVGRGADFQFSLPQAAAVAPSKNVTIKG